MEYTSNKLIHFAGRSLQTDKERFELLIKIIRGGKLFANISNPDRPQVSTSTNYNGERAGEIFEKIDCVCFCDIPDNALEIHTKKYSKFGIGFNRHYIASKGAHPVMYIPMNYNIKEIYETLDLPKKPKDYFNKLSKRHNSMMLFLIILNQLYPYSTSINPLRLQGFEKHLSYVQPDLINDILQGKSHEILVAQQSAITDLLAYIKLFDETLDPNDEDNYYMEREWRILKSVEFNISNMESIYLPSKEYEEKFINIFPDYKGEFYIL